MKHIPDYYRTPERLSEASRMLRWFICEENVSPSCVVNDFAALYDEGLPGRDSIVAREILAIIGQVLEYAGSEAASLFADKCAVLRHGRHSLAETVALKAFRYAGTPGADFSDNVREWKGLTDACSFDLVKYLGRKDDLSNVLAFKSRDPFMAYRQPDGQLCLAVICPETMDCIADEEPFADNKPLYFGEASHFYSPVDAVRSFHQILEKILIRIGYPMVRIRRRVLLASPELNLLNRDDYQPGGAYASEWRGVEVFERSQMGRKPFIGKTVPLIIPDEKSEWLRMDLLLVYSLVAAAIVYNAAGHDSHSRSLTSARIDKLIERTEIFDVQE